MRQLRLRLRDERDPCREQYDEQGRSAASLCPPCRRPCMFGGSAHGLCPARRMGPCAGPRFEPRAPHGSRPFSASSCAGSPRCTSHFPCSDSSPATGGPGASALAPVAGVDACAMPFHGKLPSWPMAASARCREPIIAGGTDAAMAHVLHGGGVDLPQIGQGANLAAPRIDRVSARSAMRIQRASDAVLARLMSAQERKALKEGSGMG